MPAFDRDAHLFPRSRRRVPVQRGLFDRRAERETGRRAEFESAREAAESNEPANGAPDLKLLLFITS